MSPNPALLTWPRQSGEFFSDNFNRADSGTLGAEWTNTFQGFRVLSNVAAGFEGQTNTCIALLTNYSALNCFVQADVLVAGPSVAVAARFSSGADTGYLWRYSTSNTSTQFASMSNGVLTNLGVGYAAAQDTPFTLRLEIVGNELRGYVNGVLRQTLTDSTHTTNTGVGMRTAGSSSTRFDNFEFGAL